MISNLPPQRARRPFGGGPTEVPFMWPHGFTKWSRKYFLAHVVEFVRTCELTARNQRLFLRLCRHYAERIEIECLAAKYAKRRSRIGRRDHDCLVKGIFFGIDRERRVLTELGLPRWRDLHK